MKWWHAARACLRLLALATPRPGTLLVAYAGIMLTICLLACVVPTLLALRVQPAEAFRSE